MIKTILAAAIVAAAASATARADTMAELRWDKRVVIVFANAGDPGIAEQRQALSGSETALAERDLIAFAVVEGRLEPIYGDPPAGETAKTLRQRYDIAAATPFTALLIGKDGGVKLRQTRPIPAATLQGTIDAMPMRRDGQR